MIDCSGCGHACPDGTKFCPECGAPSARSCASCGHPIGASKFCPECGTPVAGAVVGASPVVATAAAGGSAPVSERRTTSVLFGDLVAFTTLSESRDPEEVRELLSEYFGVARTIVARYGGTIEKFIGDAVMAVWGVPISQEDDAERAVRAGLDLVDAVAALGASVGAPGLSMRVGITTGSVAVTLGAVNEGMVAGDAVNTAARVQTAAEPGTVWVDQETRGLTAAAVAYSDMGEHALKGKAEPARLFQADTIVAVVGGAQRVDGLEAPLAGRESELRQVKDLLHATQEDHRARVAVVTGMAGVGKSRLGWEFEKYVDGISGGVAWHRGRCLSYGDGIAFWAFAEMIRYRLGLLESDEREQVALKVKEGTAEVANDAAEAEWLEPRLNALLTPSSGTAFDRTDLFTAWTTFLERVPFEPGDPVILLFEDTQHADEGLLDLIEHLLETIQVGLFVIMLARPELLEKRPSLASGRRSTVIDLSPLTDDDMTTLVDGLVAELPVRARSAIVGRAEGIPLYAVETVRSLIDRDAVQAQDGKYVFVDHDNSLVDLDQLTAPTSLQMLIAARLDALTPIERRTVQDASVLGMAFRQTGLMALADVSAHDLDHALAELTRKGVIETEDDPRSPERGQHRFLQALVREVAYSTLARKDRRTRHLAAADHLESEGEEATAALAGIIAQHLLDALEASATRDVDVPVVSARARSALTRAAERAEALGSAGEALASVLSALKLDAEGLELAALQARGGRVAALAGSNETAVELCTAAATGYEALAMPVEMTRALVDHTRALQILGRTTEVNELVARCHQLVQDHPDVAGETQAKLLKAAAQNARSAGDQHAVTASAFALMKLAEELQDPAMLVDSMNTLGILLVDSGGVTPYMALMERSLTLAREGHLLAQLGRTLANLATDTYPNDLVEAGDLCEEAVATTKRVGDAYYTEYAVCNRAFVCWLSGDWDQLDAEVTSWLADHDPSATSGALWLMLAAVAYARGNPVIPPNTLETEDPYEHNVTVVARALSTASTAQAATATAAAALASFSADMVEDIELTLAPVIELQLRAGDLEMAERLLALFDPLLGGRGRAITRGEYPRLRGMIAAARGEDPEADLRAAIKAHEAYGAPYLLAATRFELAKWLLIQGRTEEAAQLLDQARETFARLGAIPALTELDALRDPEGAHGAAVLQL